MFTVKHYVFGIVVSLLAAPSVLQPTEEDPVAWWNLSKLLREFVNNGLEANKLQEALQEKFVLEKTEVDGQVLLDKINKDLSHVFSTNIKNLKDIKRVIELEYDGWPEYDRDQVNKSILCCEREEYDHSLDNGCSLLTQPKLTNSEPIKAPFVPPSVIRELKKSSNTFTKTITHYFAFNDGGLYMYPSVSKSRLAQSCYKYDPRLRYFFSQSRSPEAREVILIVDKEANTNDTFLEEVVTRILEALSPIDRMALCLPDGDKCRTRHLKYLSDPVWPRKDYPLGTQSLLGSIVPASEKNKKKIIANFKSWLKNIPSLSKDNEESPAASFKSHAEALASGYALFQADSPIRSYHLAYGEYHRILVYVTSKGGWDNWKNSTDLVDQFDIMIKNNVHAVIHPMQNAVSRHWDDVIIEKKNGNYNITIKITSFGNYSELHSSPTSIASFGLIDPDQPVIPMPYWDAFGNGYIMSLCIPLTKGTEFLGSLCSDISVINLLEEKTSIEGIEDAYVFIVNSLGYTCMHPLLPLPHSITQDPTYVTINSLEQAEKVKPLLETIVRQIPGSSDVDGMQVQPVGRPRGSTVPGPVRLLHKKFRYQWAPINGTDLTIALVLPLENGKVFSSQYRCYNESTCETNNFQYHIAREADERKLCSFFGTPVMESQGLVKFAPSCFIDVLSYLNETPDKEKITKLYKIFNGTAPPDELFRRDLQPSVRLLEEAESLWLEQLSKEPTITDHIGIRFMGTADGAFISFPGPSLREAYDHRKRPWYLRTVSNIERDSIAMTSPYCDEFGAGMVYTITKALYDSDGKPVAVVAGDVTFQYILTNFNIQISQCKTKSTCILIDRLGYVILKSDWSTMNTSPLSCQNNKDIEGTHLIRVAPDIAEDMIAQGILQRRACHDYEEDVTFYYWSFGLKGYETLHRGPNYIVHKIAQTSLYLIVRRGEPREGFCNCDPFLRGEAVNCHDTCALECECPCVAGKDTKPCHNSIADVHSHPVPACKPRGLTEIRANSCIQSDLEPCKLHKKSDCFGKNESDCSKVVFCLWSNDSCKYLADIAKNRTEAAC